MKSDNLFLKRSRDLQEGGFTLLELLVSMAVFSLVMAVIYGVVDSAGSGFHLLRESRMEIEQSRYFTRQMRMDTSYLSRSSDKSIHSVTLFSDHRGGSSFDQLTLLVRESGSSMLSYVRYYIDEEKGELIRESKNPWARDGVEPIRWVVQRMESFDVSFLSQQKQWIDTLSTSDLPIAIRIRIRDSQGEREWQFPVYLDGQA